jgi:uncharacterized iron-regulated protein
VIFFGEYHDDPICHWLEFEITKDLFERKNGQIVLGSEMFESDNQMVLNEYLTGKINEKQFRSEAKMWPNYQTDYRPVVEFAKENQINYIATNIPRRYAAMVAANGFEILDSLDSNAKELFAPLPIQFNSELNCYQQLKEMKNMGNRNNPSFLPEAQAVKDATMAYFISINMRSEKLFIHFNGAFHSDNFEGIVWYLTKWKSVNVGVISVSRISNIMQPTVDDYAKGIFTILVPESMNRTH